MEALPWCPGGRLRIFPPAFPLLTIFSIFSSLLVTSLQPRNSELSCKQKAGRQRKRDQTAKNTTKSNVPRPKPTDPPSGPQLPLVTVQISSLI